MNFQRILGVFLRYYYTLMKSLFHLSDVFYWPLIDILLWGLTSVWIQKQYSEVHNLPLILMTGLIFWQMSWRGSIDIAVSLLQEFWHRNLVNFFSTPLKFAEWIFGILLLSVGKLIITILFGSLIVFLLYALNVFTIGWAFLPFAVSLLIFGWTIGFIASSGIVYWGHSVEMFAWMIGGLFAPFSAVFYPVSVLPQWAQVIAWSIPSTYIFEGMRSIFATGVFPSHYFWISMLLNTVYLTLSILLFKYMFEKSRKKGFSRLE